MDKNTKSKVLPVLLTLFVVLADQFTKTLVVANIPRLTPYEDNGIIQILGDYVRLIHVRNNAIAFSMGHSLPDNVRRFLFGMVPLVVVVMVFVVYFRNNEFSRLQRWSICGILGGGIGNLIDRFFRPEGVVDFVDCYFFGLFGMERWPTYNVADIAVVVCGILFVISFMLQAAEESKAKKSGGSK